MGGTLTSGGFPFSCWEDRLLLRKDPSAQTRSHLPAWRERMLDVPGLCSALPAPAAGAKLVRSGRQTGTEPTAERHRGSPRLQPLPLETQTSPQGAGEAAQPPVHGLMASDDFSRRCFNCLCPGFSLAACSAQHPLMYRFSTVPLSCSQRMGALTTSGFSHGFFSYPGCAVCFRSK